MSDHCVRYGNLLLSTYPYTIDLRTNQKVVHITPALARAQFNSKSEPVEMVSTFNIVCLVRKVNTYTVKFH